jgi:hypothetical protein
MFSRLAKSGLVKFRLGQPWRIAPGPRETMFSKDMFSKDIHSNDNLPGFRRPAATGKRRSPSPALACHWFDCNGRLECRWRVESFDETSVEEPDARRISSKMAARAGHPFESRTISLRCVARASLDDAI